jgi:hypothetical protein
VKASADVFIHADGTVEARSRIDVIGPSFREPVPNTPRRKVGPFPLPEAAERDYWVRTWQLLRTAPGGDQAATHGVRIWVEVP